MGFRDLLAFLTALPVGPGSLERAARSYPLVPLAGLAVGALSLVGAVTGYVGGGLLASSLYLAIHVAVTGGLHLDGYADFSDVIHSGARGPDALRILKDPRRGAGAVIAVTALVAVQLASVASLLDTLGLRGAWPALLVSHVLAYESMYLASAALPPTPYRGLARVFREHGLSSRGRAVNLAALAAALAPAALCEPVVLAGEAAGWVLGFALAARSAWLRLGYANGDVLGYVNEFSRTVTLAAGAVAAGVSAWLAIP